MPSFAASRFNPTFIQIDNATQYVKPLNPWNALMQAGTMPPALLQANEAKPLAEITDEARLKGVGPIVVFPEVSNGGSLYNYLPCFPPLMVLFCG